jgi:outer membrane protein assembly factor BamA
LRLVVVGLAFLASFAIPASADVPARPIVGFRVRGDSKLTERTVGYLAHVKLGDPVTPGQIPQLEAALLSSELFENVKVTLEDAPGGVIVVAMLADKQSWIVAPTAYVLGGNQAVGVGYVENNLLGQDRKLLLYGQYGNRTSMLFGTYLDPSVQGSPLMVRTDLYLLRRVLDEYVNPADDARSKDIGRTSTYTFLDAGALVGWTFAWWLVADVRLRGAYVYYRDAHDASGNPLPVPDKDGWDVTAQTHITLDARKHRYGLSWGPYAQLVLDKSVPGLDSYGYGDALIRAYYSWRLFDDHELELRANLSAGYHLPAHEELTLGGQTDLRGYDLEQFRGDSRAFYRAEYSVPLFRWRWFSFRAIGFYDGGYVGFHANRDEDRDYLPTQMRGNSWVRNNAGGGLRVYLNNIVLPLLGLDFGYGIEGRSPEVYFEVGLTDF